MGKENRRTKMTRMLIRTALTELMREKPFSSITIKEICDRADLNRTTFYKHYADQEAVLNEIEAELVQRTMDYMKDVSPDIETIEFIEAFLQYVRENADLFRILFCGTEHEEKMISYMRNVLTQLRPSLPDYGTKEQESYVLSFLMHGCFHVLLTWIDHDFSLPEKEVASLLYLMCDGVSSNLSKHFHAKKFSRLL